jgi:hypothetical protein
MASIITATTTSGLTQSADNSGVLQLASGTGNLVTVPSVTGTAMVSGNMPAFSAYQSSNQTLSSTTFTKLQFQTEEFDTANAFDSTTNYRFTPLVAGYYQISGGLLVNSSATSIRLAIYKNGTSFKNLALTNSALVSAMYSSALVFLNGSTDYVELYGYLTTGQALDASSASNVYFQAAMIRSS